MSTRNWTKEMDEFEDRKIQRLKEQKESANHLSEARDTETSMSSTTTLKCILPGQLFVRLDNANSISKRIFIRLDPDDHEITNVFDTTMPPNLVPVMRVNIIGLTNDGAGLIQFFSEDRKIIPLDMDLFDGDNFVTSNYQI